MSNFGDVKMDIKIKMKTGDNEGAKRDLLKAKMSIYNKLDTIDKIFIDYNLALYYSDEMNSTMVDMYIDSIENIFNNDSFLKDELAIEYCNYLWLKTYENKDIMSYKEIEDNMNYVYDYYISIGKYSYAIGSIANIYLYKKDIENILKKLEDLLILSGTEDETFIDEILLSCEKIDHNLYIKALDLIKVYSNI